MSNIIDDPVIIWVLLALILGLRLALYLTEKWEARQPVAASPLPLTPDETTDVVEIYKPELKVAKKTSVIPYTIINELLDAALIAIILVFFIIRPFILQAFYIPTGSMVPTLQENDKLIVLKYPYHFRSPRRGEVVVFRAPEIAISTSDKPDYAQVDYVKRVIGVPGDRIHIVDGEGVYINDKLLHEPYVAASPDYDFPYSRNGLLQGVNSEVNKQLQSNISGNDLIVPPGFLFVMGDNRRHSHDSHRWGLLPRKTLVGKAYFLFWPPHRIGRVE